MWFPTEKKTVLEGLALTNNAMNTIRAEWPLDGCGITKIRLTLHATTSGRTDATLVDRHAPYNYLKGITLRTSRGEVFYNSVPGRAVYEMNALFDGITSRHDVILVANGTYDAVLDLYCATPFLNRPEDTVLDTGRYSNLELSLFTGGVADFLAAGTDTPAVAVTLDIEVERTLACLAEDGMSKPKVHPFCTTYAHQLQTVREYWDLESAMDSGLFMFMVKATPTGYTKPFEGPGLDDIEYVTFRDSLRAYVDYSLPESMRMACHERLKFDPTNIYIATPAATEQIAYPLLGNYPHFFVRNGSMNEAFSCGKKSMLRVEYGLATVTSYAALLTYGYRTLRG